jgi:hypothetical protein
MVRPRSEDDGGEVGRHRRPGRTTTAATSGMVRPRSEDDGGEVVEHSGEIGGG